MSLFDVDPHSDSRGSPMPNVHDQLLHTAVPAKATNSINYTTPSTDKSAILAGKNGQFTIAQVGTYVTTSTINTSAPGAGNYVAETNAIYSAPHNLNFVPGLMAYELSDSGQYAPMPYTRFFTNSSTQALWYTFYIIVDSTSVAILLNTMTYGSVSFSFVPGFSFKWYLLQQTSN